MSAYEMNSLKACVLGLGEVGLPTAKYIADLGIEIYGYDIDGKAIEVAQKNGISRATLNWENIPLMDVYVICVNSGMKGGAPDFSSLFDVCEKIRSKINSSKSVLVSIESTIIPGISDKVFRETFHERVHLVHVPHRYWAGDPIDHGVKQLRVMGAVDVKSLDHGLRFYRDTLKIPLHVAPSIEVAELSKIAENACRYVEIAFAEELYLMCEELGLDFEEVRNACNTKWNIDIREAREGIKGHCLPKDMWYFTHITTANTLIKSAMETDKEYRERIWQQDV